MTRARCLCGIAAACLALTAGVAVASTSMDAVDQPVRQIPATSISQEASQPSLRPGRQGPDADADGRISRAEFVDARLRPLMAMDADSDGTVSVAERTAWHQDRMAARTTRRFERLDADGNGTVTRAEFDAASQKARGQHGERRAHRGGHGHYNMQARGGQRADRMPAGGAPSAPLAITEARTRAEAVFSRLDQDADGFITRAERQSARGEARQRSGAGREGRSMRRQGRMQADPISASPASPASE